MESDKIFELSELFIHDQPRKKYICQVLVGNGKCLSELSDANNTSIRKNHLKAKHGQIKYVKLLIRDTLITKSLIWLFSSILYLKCCQ